MFLKMKQQLVFCQFITWVFVFAASIQKPDQSLYLENELVLDLGSKDEWIVIETDPNHIIYFTFLLSGTEADDGLAKQQISSSLTIFDANKPDSVLFPPTEGDTDDKNIQLSPFYSTGNAVSIKFVKSSSFDRLQLKAAKAVPCPFNIGGSSSCGRVVDALSCYCALFSRRTWEDTKSYCRANNMSIVSIETYEEDLALFSTFGGNEVLWIGARDTVSEGNFVWDSTGKSLSPGYVSWVPGFPLSTCSSSSTDCVVYTNTEETLPAWVDFPCTTNSWGGICELQPSNSSNATRLQQTEQQSNIIYTAHSSSVVELFLEKEMMILDLSGSSANEFIIQTDPDRILYFSFLTPEDADDQLIASSIIISEKQDLEVLFPNSFNRETKLSSFYSTGNTVSIKFTRSSSDLNGFRLKIEKAVSCPFNIGGSTSCGRIVDELSCYCALFTLRTWADTKTYCKSNNFNFVAIETYEEDFALLTAFGGNDFLWIGASDTANEGKFVWDSTGKTMSPGYVGWVPGSPRSTCVSTSYDCATYNKNKTLPAWVDTTCSSTYGGICELQP